MRILTLPLALSLLLAACASAPPGAPTEAPATPPAPQPPSRDQRAAAPAHLAMERLWLSSWFKGTPVVIRQRADDAMTIDVPREFCFAPGKSNVKPALAAVLDKLAESLRRVPFAEVALVAAPADANGSAQLALQRASEVQHYLRLRGVQPGRLAKPTATSESAVQLRVETPSL